MTRLVWGEGPRLFDQGVDRGVLYLDGSGVPWNGLVAVEELASGTVNTDYYYDGNRLWVSQVTGDFEANVSAFTYPEAFAEYNGYSERKIYQRFGLSYRTQYGDGYKLHIVYNVLVGDTNRGWQTVSNSIDPSLFQWGVKASAVPIPGASPAARLTMEVGADPDILSAIEDVLYGTDTTDPRLPDPQELYELYESTTLLRILYHPDGTYTAVGPDDMVTLQDDGSFKLTAPSVYLAEQDIFTVSSY